MPSIAVDAMGGDHAPEELVKGVAQVSLETDIECLLVGDERRIQSVLACAKHFRLIRGIRRAALASVYPRQTEHAGQDRLALMVDVGATIRCEAEELVHFALMGSAYARRISKVPSPRVALLNMGSEENKGGEVLVEAHRRLRHVPALNFVGNVEGQELVRGKADVIVCDGFLVEPVM